MYFDFFIHCKLSLSSYNGTEHRLLMESGLTLMDAIGNRTHPVAFARLSLSLKVILSIRRNPLAVAHVEKVTGSTFVRRKTFDG